MRRARLAPPPGLGKHRAMGGSGVERGGGRGILWQARVPVVLLLAVALVQLVLVRELGLSPWKGGGFGMFSTLDNSNFRTVRVIGIEHGGDVPIVLPPETERLRRAIRILPFRPWLAELAADAFRAAPDARAVRIEVWRISFDPDGLRPSQHLLRRAVFRVGP
jgi:hypothetical protein